MSIGHANCLAHFDATGRMLGPAYPHGACMCVHKSSKVLGYVQVNARVLPPPTLQYAKEQPPKDVGYTGAWNLEKVAFFDPKVITSLAIVSFCDERFCGGGFQNPQSLEVSILFPSWRVLQGLQSATSSLGFVPSLSCPPYLATHLRFCSASNSASCVRMQAR